MIAIGSVFLALLSSSAYEAPVKESASLHRQALAAGKWQSQRGSAVQRDWQVQIKHRDDGVISGRVLLDDAGQEVGDFTGSVGKEGAGGTYRMKDGDEGSWSTPVGSETAIGAVNSEQTPATPAPVDGPQS